MKILKGVKPSDIKIARNERGKLIINIALAKKLKVIFKSQHLRVADKIK